MDAKDSMRWEFRFRAIFVLILLAVCLPCARGQQSAMDLDGHALDPLATGSGKVVVLVFLRRDCPVSGRYAPAVQQISKRFADRANFWLIYPDKSDTAQDIRKSVEEYRYHLPVLRDPQHALVKLSHVQITPEVAVFNRDRHLVYDGRIDDWYIDSGWARSAPTTHELEDAIRAASAGESMARNEVRGVGCYISDLE